MENPKHNQQNHKDTGFPMISLWASYLPWLYLTFWGPPIDPGPVSRCGPPAHYRFHSLLHRLHIGPETIRKTVCLRICSGICLIYGLFFRLFVLF